MQSIRQVIGGLGNLMFLKAYVWSQMRDGLIPDQYVQGEKYFAKYKNEIKQMFSHGIGHDNRVALHIRRGDYLKATQFHTPLYQTDYYKEAVKLFSDERFLVFCKDNQDSILDAADKEWCKEYMTNLGVDFDMHEHGSETDDMNLMASCKSLIMANSTFSWFAAYLGGHEKVVCVSEKQWYTDGIVRTEVLPEWIQLSI
jgi:hypothetical protein